MAVPAGYDIKLTLTDPAEGGSGHVFMVAPDAVKQDITPASTRRSDGDTRFLVIQTESFWSQSDWAGGYGIDSPADPTSYMVGPVSSEIPHQLRAAQTGLTASGYPSDGVTYHLLAHAGAAWAVMNFSGAFNLCELVGTSWTGRVALPQMPTSVVSYRDKIFLAYGDGAGSFGVQSWNGTTLASVGFNARHLCPYSSMLAYVTKPLGETAWKLSRYDPENPGVNPVLAIFSSSALPPSAMAALGGDLYIMFPGALWRFTSSNGNSGILTGPVDAWTNTAPTADQTSLAAALIVHKGGLYYTTGRTIRSYLPGGQARTLWPAPPHDAALGLATPDSICGLASVADQLYAVASEASGVVSGNVKLLCWTGSGMHTIGMRSVGYSSSTVGYGLIAVDATGTIWLGMRSGLISGGKGTFGFSSNPLLTRTYYRWSTWYSSLLDFGMLDIPKSVSQFGVLATVPAGGGIDVAVSVDGGAYQTLTAATSWIPGDPAKLLYYRLSSGLPLVGKTFRLRLDLYPSTSTWESPVVTAITAIPNPVNPIRYGFRFTIPLDELVETHTGERAFDLDFGAPYLPLGTGIQEALDFLHLCRRQAYPILLDWLDGATYKVRFNTLTVQRLTTVMGSRPSWRVTIDAQELS